MTFKTKDALNRHMRVRRFDLIFFFECDQCPMTFKTKDALNRHMRVRDLI
jgi:hypothetical protein